MPDVPPMPPHRLPIRVLNALGRRRARPAHDPQRWLDRARRRTGLSDTGIGPIDEQLARMAEDFNDHAGLSPFGHGVMDKLVTGLIQMRMRITHAHASRPDAQAQRIERPVFIIGGPRTGTTLLYRLMAANPAARPLMVWEAGHPPHRPLTAWRRIAKVRIDHAVVNYLMPEMPSIHELRPTGPEEDIVLLLRTLTTWILPLIAAMPRYLDWLWHAPDERFVQAYQLHKQQLQLHQQRRGGGYWLLKGPAHLNCFGHLFDVYPDARIVQTQRDLRSVIPSACSLCLAARRLTADSVDPARIGAEAMDSARRSLDRAMTFREHIPAGQLIDVHFPDLMADPVAELRRVHEALGLPIDAAFDQTMRDELAANPRHRRGMHRYTAEQFGIAPAELDALADDHAARFGLPAAK